jgi:L-fucose isomerase-like protein
MDRRMRLGLAVVASPLEVGAEAAPTLQERARSVLRMTGGDRLDLVVCSETVDSVQAAVLAGRELYDLRVDAICVVAASWFEDYLVLDMLEECDAPILGWAVPGMETGSLCGMQQLGFVLRQLGRPYDVLYRGIDSEDAAQRVLAYGSAAALRRRLRSARVGYLGHRVEGMTETTGHELALKRIFGLRIVGIDTQLFLQRSASADPEDGRARWAQLQGEVGSVVCGEEAGLESLRVYAALKQVAEEELLSAVAVGCYPSLMGQVCLAASLLGEEGVPVACEGDVNGALGMLMLTWLSGEPVHNTDLLNPIPEDNSIVFSHCGSGGFSLAEDPSEITLAPVRLMDRGLCCLFTARPGPVTLINIVPTMSGYQMALLFGTAVQTNMVFPGNPLRVRFESPHRDILSWIVREGIGHHWMAAYGDWRVELSQLANLVGCSLCMP